jgi:hypothetical protein
VPLTYDRMVELYTALVAATVSAGGRPTDVELDALFDTAHAAAHAFARGVKRHSTRTTSEPSTNT